MKTAVVLCGGEGARLGGTVAGPKCLVKVGGKRVVDYVLEWLFRSGVEQAVLSAGPLWRAFTPLGTARVAICRGERERRLGTGGAASQAVYEFPSWFRSQSSVPVLNGDTILWGGSIPSGSSSTTVAVSDHGPAFRVVSRRDLIDGHGLEWSIEDLAGAVENVLGLGMIDVGTPEGLASARRKFGA